MINRLSLGKYANVGSQKCKVYMEFCKLHAKNFLYQSEVCLSLKWLKLVRTSDEQNT